MEEVLVKDFDLMVDTEGLSWSPHGVILSMAVVPFRMKDSDSLETLVKRGLYLKFNVKEQIGLGRHIDKGTVDWWKRQSEDAKKILIPSEEDVYMKEGLEILGSYISNWYTRKTGIFWARGIQYDWSLIDDIYHHMEVENPMNGWLLQDTKTMMRMLTGDLYAKYDLDSGVPEGFVAHDALYDACHEVLKVQELYKKFFK